MISSGVPRSAAQPANVLLTPCGLPGDAVALEEPGERRRGQRLARNRAGEDELLVRPRHAAEDLDCRGAERHPEGDFRLSFAPPEDSGQPASRSISLQRRARTSVERRAVRTRSRKAAAAGLGSLSKPAHEIRDRCERHGLIVLALPTLLAEPLPRPRAGILPFPQAEHASMVEDALEAMEDARRRLGLLMPDRRERLVNMLVGHGGDVEGQ